MNRKIKKVLIANRGEIALRIIRTLKERRIKSVAVCSDADRFAPYTRMADEVYHLPGKRATDTYLNMELLLDVAGKAKVDAVHPGYGFLAENPEFARAVEENNLIFIGPSPWAMELLGDKARARETAIRQGVPVVPGSEGVVESPEKGLEIAKNIGYPVMIKAKAGGGGKGMRIVQREEEFLSSFRTASSEAMQAFGDGGLYLEKAILKPRHVEVQIVADYKGNVIHLFERDCSVQRRHQKLVEESPAPNLSRNLREKLWESAIKIAKASKYVNAGTVEFLVEGENFYFMEVNARLQVEHPITEIISGTDLVALQLDVEEGVTLKDSVRPSEPYGCAMEFRLNAEDPYEGFIPAPGNVSFLKLSEGPGVRIDSGIEAGGYVPIEYDPLFAKVIVFGKDREEVLRRAQRAFDEIEIQGIKTTLPFHRWLIQNNDFVKGNLHTSLAENFSPELSLSDELICGSAVAYLLLKNKTLPLFSIKEQENWKKKSLGLYLKKKYFSKD